MRPTIIVTGGSRGIGRGITRMLAKDGHDIIFTYNSNAEAAAENKAFIEKNYNVSCHYLQANFITENKKSVNEIYNFISGNCASHFKGFVHNAGGYRHDPKARPTIENAQLYSNWYSNTFLLLMEGALKAWENSSTSVKTAVAISSPGCNISGPPHVPYLQPGIGKSAMEYLVRCYAKDLRSKGITVNTVIPGYVRTDAWDPILSTESGSEFAKQSMEARTGGGWIPTEEIGGVVAFLVSSNAKSITGQHLSVDRGLHMSI